MGKFEVEVTSVTKIITNKIRCRKCGDIVESVSVHDFRRCRCGAVAADGGHEYLRRIGNKEDWEDLSEFLKVEKRCYIAYGSNLNIRQMKERCPQAEIVGTSVIPDYELLFKGEPAGAYLTITPKKGAEVPVAVWLVTEEDEAALDEYEGWPFLYYKTEMELPVKEIQSGETVKRECFIYIMYSFRNIGEPTPGYVDICLEGYRDFGFDRTYLDEALKQTKEELCCYIQLC